jgi:hypothetical protein
MARRCSGLFDEKTIARIRDDIRNDPVAAIYSLYPCAKCGAQVTAENKGRFVIPRNHEAPAVRANDKSVGRKVSNKPFNSKPHTGQTFQRSSET